MMKRMLFIALFSFILQGNIDGADGENFVDDFAFHDKNLWTDDHDFLHCVGFAESGQCVYKSADNLRWEYVTGKTPHSELVLTMRNDCEGKKCCKGNFCTHYTTGQISSVHRYGYGTFRFLAHALHRKGFKDTSEINDAWSCFSLESVSHHLPSARLDSITFCLPTHDSYRAIILLQYDGEATHLQLKLPFSAAKKTSLYRIDWAQKSISFWMNGIELITLTSAKYSIPDIPMFIKVFCLPRIRAPFQVSIGGVELNLHLLKVRYRSFPDKPDKTELFVISNQQPQLLTTKFLILCISILSTPILWCLLAKRGYDYITILPFQIMNIFPKRLFGGKWTAKLILSDS